MDPAKFNLDTASHMLESLGAMGIIGTIVIGLAAGIVAKILMAGRVPGGLILTCLLGIAGSYVATFLGQAFDITIAGQVSGFIAAVAGSFLLLLLYRLLFRGRG